MLHKKLGCYKGGIQISSNAKELVLKEKGQTLSHLQTLHITASRSSQEEERAGGGGVVSNRTGVDWTEKAGLNESQRKGSILISKPRKLIMLLGLSTLSSWQHFRLNSFKYQMSYVALCGRLKRGNTERRQE